MRSWRNISTGSAFLLAGKTYDALIVRTSQNPRHSADSYGPLVKRLTRHAMKEDKPEFFGRPIVELHTNPEGWGNRRVQDRRDA
jgi:hypothetical protein